MATQDLDEVSLDPSGSSQCGPMSVGNGEGHYLLLRHKSSIASICAQVHIGSVPASWLCANPQRKLIRTPASININFLFGSMFDELLI